MDILKWLSGLLSENGKASLGRWAFWALFFLTLYMWYNSQTVGEQQYNLVLWMLIYNFGKKGVPLLKLLAGRDQKEKSNAEAP